MNPEYHRQLREARQRIARNRRAIQSDLVRTSTAWQAKLNWKLQSQKHPVAMLIGAAAVGAVASRLVSRFAGGRGWEQSLFNWAKANIGSRFWKQLLNLFMARGDDVETEDIDDDTEDAS